VALAATKKITGDNTQFKITGGSNTNVLTTDGAGALTWGVPAAKVLQVIQTYFTGTASSTSATPADVAGFSAIITPSAVTNKVLVTVNVTFGFDTGDPYPYILLLRGATSIGEGVGATGVQINTFLSGTNVPVGTGSQYKYIPASQTYLDSPSATVATTYKIQLAQPQPGYTGYINRQGHALDQVYVQHVASSITLMEIGA
jgi:hypothetical protein